MVTKEVEFFPKQFDAYNFKTQFGAVICGVQSGKTFLGTYWAGKKIEQFPDKNGLISAPSYKILQHSTLEKFFREFPMLQQYYKRQREVIELPTGGKVFIRSADKPLGIEGMTIHWGWLDEYGQAPRLAWLVCKARVSTTGGQLLITTTPYALNWLYEEIYKPWREGTDSQVSVFTWRSIDNPYFPRDFYEAEKKRLSETEFRRRYMGEFTRMEGLVYSDFTSDLIIEPREIVGETIAGIDFGFNNPTAIAVIRIDKDNNYYLIDEYYRDGKTQDEINEVCKNLQQKYNIRMFYPDPSEPDRIESMKRAGIYVRESNNDLVAGIDRVRELIRKKQFFIFKTCKHALDEIETYHYPEPKEGISDETPVKQNDHMMDAIRYPIFTYSPKYKVTINIEDRFFQQKMKQKIKRSKRGYRLKLTGY